MALTCTADGLVNEYHCAKCLSEKDLLAALAMVLYAINNQGDTTVGTAVEDGKCFCISKHQFLEAIFNAFLAFAIDSGYLDNANAAYQAGACFTCVQPDNIRGMILENLCEFLNTRWPIA